MAATARSTASYRASSMTLSPRWTVDAASHRSCIVANATSLCMRRFSSEVPPSNKPPATNEPLLTGEQGEKKKRRKPKIPKEDKVPVEKAKPLFTNFYDPQLPISRFFDDPRERRKIGAGRAWFADELRNKSFEDLQKLYMVLLIERNKLLSERYRARRVGTTMEAGSRGKKVRQSVARILTVINERSREKAARRAELNTVRISTVSSIARSHTKRHASESSDSSPPPTVTTATSSTESGRSSAEKE